MSAQAPYHAVPPLQEIFVVGVEGHQVGVGRRHHIEVVVVAFYKLLSHLLQIE